MAERRAMKRATTTSTDVLEKKKEDDQIDYENIIEDDTEKNEKME